MRESNTRTVVEQKPLGVIDVVSAGLDLVRRRWWTLLFPILVDAIIWVMPRLSLTQLLRPSVDQMLQMASLSGDPQVVEETRQTLEQLTQSFNLLNLVATALNNVARFPSLFRLDTLRATMLNVPGPINALAYSQPLLSPELIVVLFVPLFLLGLLMVAVYLELIAQGVRPLERQSKSAALIRIAELWLRLIFFALLLVGMLLGAGIVMALLQAFLPSPELATFAALLLTIGLFWIFIYFFFVTSAMAVSGVSLRMAIRQSTLLFRVFFWSAVGLVLLSVFLDRGLAIIWDGLTVSSLGVAVAIAANAYIGTSLIAAAMVFYQDRMHALERMRQKMKTAPRK
jgi:hypothetical protein